MFITIQRSLGMYAKSETVLVGLRAELREVPT